MSDIILPGDTNSPIIQEGGSIIQPATMEDLKNLPASINHGNIHDAAERAILGRMESTKNAFRDAFMDDSVLAALKTSGDLEKYYRNLKDKIASMRNIVKLLRTDTSREKAEQIIREMEEIQGHTKQFRAKTETLHVAEMGSGAQDSDIYDAAASRAEQYEEGSERVF